jgi:hypothetical protein
MVAHDALGRTLDGSDRPELTVPPHHAFRRVWRSRRQTSFATPHYGCPALAPWALMKKRSHSGCSQIVWSQ